MTKLAADFKVYTPSEEQYADGYFAYNFPMNLVKTIVVIEEIEKHYPDLLAGRERLNVLDIGCGDGAGICGFYYALKDTPLIQEFRFLGVDSSPKMLERARVLARWLGNRDARVKIYFRKQRIEDLNMLDIKRRYDVIMCVNSLAEIINGDNIPMRFIHSVHNILSDSGLLVIIEPALKGFARRLMRLRNELVSQSKGKVMLPCLHGEPCALLMVDKRNEWCHQSVNWLPPDFLEILNKGINREIDVLKFAYLVIARTRSQQNIPHGYRVVSNLLREKGKQRCFLCTPKGRVELVKLDKSHSTYNKNFSAITMGSVVNIEREEVKKDNYWQVTEKTRVEIKE
jgi:ribosomal protein RSM22 (predicted rRNA methylase)